MAPRERERAVGWVPVTDQGALAPGEEAGLDFGGGTYHNPAVRRPSQPWAAGSFRRRRFVHFVRTVVQLRL